MYGLTHLDVHCKALCSGVIGEKKHLIYADFCISLLFVNTDSLSFSHNWLLVSVHVCGGQ